MFVVIFNGYELQQFLYVKFVPTPKNIAIELHIKNSMYPTLIQVPTNEHDLFVLQKRNI